MTYREEEAVIAKAGAKCFYTNRRAARKCSYKVGVRFCPSPCEHKVEPQYAIPVTDCAAQTVGSGCQTHAAPEPTVRLLSLLPPAALSRRVGARIGCSFQKFSPALRHVRHNSCLGEIKFSPSGLSTLKHTAAGPSRYRHGLRPLRLELRKPL